MTAAATASPARRLRDAIEPVAMVYAHAPEAHEEYEALGLPRWHGYVLGRASALGLPPAVLVVATFGAFEPEMLTTVYEHARATASAADALAARERGAGACLRRVLGEPDREAAEVVAVLQAGIDAAPVLGKPLFAGHTALDPPADPWARLWHAANTLREFRGDAHLAALVAHGIGVLESNLLTEAWVGLTDRAYTRTRSWSEAAVEDATDGLVDRGLAARHGDGIVLTARGTRVRGEVEAATDAALDPVMEGIGTHLDLVVDRCLRWSAALRAAGAFPDDDHKLRAG